MLVLRSEGLPVVCAAFLVRSHSSAKTMNFCLRRWNSNDNATMNRFAASELGIEGLFAAET